MSRFRDEWTESSDYWIAEDQRYYSQGPTYSDTQRLEDGLRAIQQDDEYHRHIGFRRERRERRRFPSFATRPAGR